MGLSVGAIVGAGLMALIVVALGWRRVIKAFRWLGPTASVSVFVLVGMLVFAVSSKREGKPDVLLPDAFSKYLASQRLCLGLGEELGLRPDRNLEPGVVERIALKLGFWDGLRSDRGLIDRYLPASAADDYVKRVRSLQSAGLLEIRSGGVLGSNDLSVRVDDDDVEVLQHWKRVTGSVAATERLAPYLNRGAGWTVCFNQPAFDKEALQHDLSTVDLQSGNATLTVTLRDDAPPALHALQDEFVRIFPDFARLGASEPSFSAGTVEVLFQAGAVTGIRHLPG